MSDHNFSIEKNIHTYLLGVAKYLWMNELRKKGRHYTDELDTNAKISSMEESPIELIINSENKKIIYQLLNVMKQQCKEVLMYWSSGYKMAEITELLSYNSEGAVRKKKSDCLKQLDTYLNDHPRIRTQLKNTLLKY